MNKTKHEGNEKLCVPYSRYHILLIFAGKKKSKHPCSYLSYDKPHRLSIPIRIVRAVYHSFYDVNPGDLDRGEEKETGIGKNVCVEIAFYFLFEILEAGNRKNYENSSFFFLKKKK